MDEIMAAEWWKVNGRPVEEGYPSTAVAFVYVCNEDTGWDLPLTTIVERVEG